MIKKLKTYVISIVYLFVFIVLFFLTTPILLAQPFNDDVDFIPSTPPTTLDNPIGQTDINILIGTIINAIMGIVGSLALAMFIYGGFTWMTAAGASEKVQKGKDIIIWATIGLIVIFSSYALVYFVLNNVIKGAAT